MIQAAQALREVRRAQIDFLLNWTREQQAAAGGDLSESTRLNLPPLSDRNDWRHLYDGSVLDD